MVQYFQYTKEQLKDKDFIINLYNNIPKDLQGTMDVVSQMETMEKEMPIEIFNDKEVLKVMMMAPVEKGVVFGEIGDSAKNAVEEFVIKEPMRIINNEKFNKESLNDINFLKYIFENFEEILNFNIIPKHLQNERFVKEKYVVTDYVNKLNLSYEKEKDLMIIACKSHREFFNKLSEKEKKDEDLIIANLSSNPKSFKDLGMMQKMNNNYILPALKEDIEILNHVPAIKYKNKAFLEEIVKINSSAFKWIPDEYKSEDLVEIALLSKNSDLAELYRYLSRDLKENKNLCKIFVERDMVVYRLMSENMRTDSELIKIACETNVWNIKYVPDEIKETEEFLYTYAEQMRDKFGLEHENNLLKIYERKNKLEKELKDSKEITKNLTKLKI